MCSYKSVQQVYHMQVWEHLLLHSWRAWHGVPAKRLRSQGVCRTSLFFLTSIHVFDSMVFVLLCGATPLPVWLEAKLKLCFQDSHVWTSSRQRAHLPSGVVGSSICIVNEGAILLFKMPTFADHNNHRTPPNQKTNFHRKLWEKDLYFRQLWEFVGFFWGPWTLNLKNHSKVFWGENPPPTDPTNRFATQLCSIWQWDRCEVASFSLHLEIGRFRHICPKLTLDQWICSLCPKKKSKTHSITTCHVLESSHGDFWRCRQYQWFFFHSDINPTQSLRSFI